MYTQIGYVSGERSDCGEDVDEKECVQQHILSFSIGSRIVASINFGQSAVDGMLELPLAPKWQNLNTLRIVFISKLSSKKCIRAASETTRHESFNCANSSPGCSDRGSVGVFK